MRKFIPIMFVAAALFVGCKSVTMKTTTSTSASTNAPVSTNSLVSTNAVAGAVTASNNPTPHVNTPSETLSENAMLGEMGATVIFLMLVVLGLRRS
jgi:hypothetical protein